MFQFRVAEFDMTGGLGLALSHPLYIIACRGMKLIPIGELPMRINFFSGVGMAVALANLAVVCTIITGRRLVGVIIAATLAVVHTSWWLATIAEVYTWSVAGLTAELWLLVVLIRRPTWGKLTGLALVSGLGLCVHNFALLPLPVYMIVAIVLVAHKRLSVRSLVVAAAAYLFGAGLYIAMTINLAISGGDAIAAIHSALFGNYSEQVLNVAGASGHFKANAVLSGMNFLNFLAPLAIIGWFRMRRRLGNTLAGAIGAITLIEILFFVRYPVPDQFTFLLPSLVMLAVGASVGVAVLVEASRRLRIIAVAACVVSVCLMPAVYSSAPDCARVAGMDVQRKRRLPYRDELRYWLVPWKHNERSAEKFVRAALDGVEPDAVIVAASTPYYALIAAQRIYRLREDVMLLGGHEPWPVPNADENIEAFFSAVGDRPLYVVSNVHGYCPEALLPYVDDKPTGLLYRVKPPSPEALSGKKSPPTSAW